MKTEQLLEIVETRISGNDGNPTSRSFLYELYQALERLKEYEDKESKFEKQEKF